MGGYLWTFESMYGKKHGLFQSASPAVSWGSEENYDKPFRTSGSLTVNQLRALRSMKQEDWWDDVTDRLSWEESRQGTDPKFASERRWKPRDSTGQPMHRPRIEPPTEKQGLLARSQSAWRVKEVKKLLTLGFSTFPNLVLRSSVFMDSAIY